MAPFVCPNQVNFIVISCKYFHLPFDQYIVCGQVLSSATPQAPVNSRNHIIIIWWPQNNTATVVRVSFMSLEGLCSFLPGIQAQTAWIYSSPLRKLSAVFRGRNCGYNRLHYQANYGTCSLQRSFGMKNGRLNTRLSIGNC